MTPKEKAIELVKKMQFEVCKTDAKQCALIAVDEILKTNPYKARNFWYEVKNEIEKL
jgi:hypothetical protein